eukprot:11169996-Lingulodinium_polyedra.AAC.1
MSVATGAARAPPCRGRTPRAGSSPPTRRSTRRPRARPSRTRWCGTSPRSRRPGAGRSECRPSAS